MATRQSSSTRGGHERDLSGRWRGLRRNPAQHLPAAGGRGALGAPGLRLHRRPCLLGLRGRAPAAGRGVDLALPRRPFSGPAAALPALLEQGRTAPLALLGPRGVGELAVQPWTWPTPGSGPGCASGWRSTRWSRAGGGGRRVHLGLRPGGPRRAVPGRARPGRGRGGVLLRRRQTHGGHPGPGPRRGPAGPRGYALDAETPGHGTVAGAIAFARQPGPGGCGWCT